MVGPSVGDVVAGLFVGEAVGSAVGVVVGAAVPLIGDPVATGLPDGEAVVGFAVAGLFVGETVGISVGVVVGAVVPLIGEAVAGFAVAGLFEGLTVGLFEGLAEGLIEGVVVGELEPPSSSVSYLYTWVLELEEYFTRTYTSPVDGKNPIPETISLLPPPSLFPKSSSVVISPFEGSTFLTFCPSATYR